MPDITIRVTIEDILNRAHNGVFKMRRAPIAQDVQDARPHAVIGVSRHLEHAGPERAHVSLDATGAELRHGGAPNLRSEVPRERQYRIHVLHAHTGLSDYACTYYWTCTCTLLAGVH
jgi:hypothetical protein